MSLHDPVFAQLRARALSFYSCKKLLFTIIVAWSFRFFYIIFSLSLIYGDIQFLYELVKSRILSNKSKLFTGEQGPPQRL